MQDEDTPGNFLAFAPEDCEAGMILINLENTEQRWQGSDAAERNWSSFTSGAYFSAGVSPVTGGQSGWRPDL